jgi:hypothetical protein
MMVAVLVILVVLFAASFVVDRIRRRRLQHRVTQSGFSHESLDVELDGRGRPLPSNEAMTEHWRGMGAGQGGFGGPG